MAAKKTLTITQTKSVIKTLSQQKATMKALGLHRIRHTVVKPDNPAIRGMLVKVRHLVSVKERV